MNGMSFANLVRDLEVDDTVFRQDWVRLTPADRTYVVVFTARSGSTWLTSVLSATKRLGFPEEYINPDFVRAVAQAQNTRDPECLLQMLKRRRRTSNGVFGIEVRAIDVALLGEEAFFRVFNDKTVFFNLWRDNIVAQSISLFRAVATGHYHSTDGQGRSPPTYDAEAIRRWLRHVAITENDNLRMLQRAQQSTIELRYEDIVRDRWGTIEAFARALDVFIAPRELYGRSEGETRKIGDDWNAETEVRFRSEQPDYVTEVEAARLVKYGVPTQDGREELTTKDCHNRPSHGGSPVAATILPAHTGLHYLEFLKAVHDTLGPRAYLEIGTRSGESLAIANCASIAIDPHFLVSSNVTGQKPLCLMYQGTSDDYFATQEPERLLGRCIDLAFIDGLHLFEYLLRDFMNTERVCHPDSVIAIHDCIPTDIYIAERKDNPARRREMGSKPSWWTGDVWKIIPVLRKYRPDTTLIAVDCAPTGLLLVTNLNRESRILAQKYQSIVDEFLEIDLADYGLERFHAEVGTRSAVSARLPLQPWDTELRARQEPINVVQRNHGTTNKNRPHASTSAPGRNAG